MKKRDLKQRITKLLDEKHLLSASDIACELEKKNSEFNITSIYRALDQLVADGQLHQYYFGAAQALYELSSHHHAHYFCQECGKVSTGECTLVESQHSHARSGFAVDHHRVTFFGRCGEC